MEEHIFNAETENLLLAKDSRVTCVVLHQKISRTASWMETFQRFYSAIVNSTVIDHLTIDFEEILQLNPGNGIAYLLKAVEECNSIETIFIKGDRLHSRWGTFGSALISAILSAISRNKNIQTCCFHGVRLDSQDLATFIQNSSIRKVEFELSDVYFNIQGGNDAPRFNENVQELKDAFNQNKTLNLLYFGLCPADTNNNRIILEAAKSSESITDLIIDFNNEIDEQYNPQIFADIAMYLNESKLDYVVFNGMKWDNITFGALASQLNRKDDPIKYLQFNDCSFDKNACILLKSFLMGDQNVDAIAFGGDKAAFHNEINVLGEIISKKKGPKSVVLSDYNGISSSMNGLDSICTGLASKTSDLETLFLPCLSSTQLEYFLEKVPTFKNIQQLKFLLNDVSEHLKGKLFSSFRCNACLMHTKIVAPWITDEDSKILDNFTYRNRKLPSLVSDVSKGQMLALSTIPSFFYTSVIATSGTGPEGIVAMLTTLGDKICNPDKDNVYSSKQLRID